MESKIPEWISESIKTEPYRFELVQLVRLLYLSHDSQGQSNSLDQKLVGYENAPGEELIRFKASPRMRHSSSDICKVEKLADGKHALTVTFMGLVGASGVLPHHYSQMVLARLRDNDETMMKFFDLFHHRMISNYFRASVKYRLPFQHELFSRFARKSKTQRLSNRGEKDVISRSISCLVGLGERSVQDRQLVDDRSRIFYAGNFSSNRPTMIGLMRMLCEYARTPIKILQFQFEWLYLDKADQTDLGNKSKLLGHDTVLGSRVGSVQNRFRIRLGPIPWRRFQELLPSQKRLQELAQLTRSYVGIGLDFDFQVVLQGDDVPCLQLGNESCGKLGWNTWITHGKLKGEIEDAVFEIRDEFNSD